MPKTSSPAEGDKVFIVNDITFAIEEKVVKNSSPDSDIIWVNAKNGVRLEMVGPQRWAKTKAEVKTKAIALARNKRSELEDKITVIDAALKKLGGN